MIQLIACDCRPRCHGFRWVIEDESALARTVAALLLGDHAHSASVLRALGAPSPPRARQATVDRLVKMLTIPAGVPAGKDGLRYQRDGLVFQLISWVAAHRAPSAARSVVRAPHVRPADKGPDGLILESPEHGRSSWRAVICEDKATTQARTTVLQSVWPEFELFAAHERDAEIRADASALAATLGSPDDVDQLLEDILWKEELHFRVCVTVDPNDATASTPEALHETLFEGYDRAVPGDPPDRRRAETLPTGEPLRPWLDRFCGRVVAELQAAITPLPNAAPPKSAAPSDGIAAASVEPELTDVGVPGVVPSDGDAAEVSHV